MKKSLMICVVSAHNVPNYRAFLKYSSQLTDVLLVKSDAREIKNKDLLLKELIEKIAIEKNINVKIIGGGLDGDNAEDYKKLVVLFEKEVDPSKFHKIYFNCTGGTKYFAMMIEDILRNSTYQNKVEFIYKPLNVDNCFGWQNQIAHSKPFELEPIKILDQVQLYTRTEEKEDEFKGFEFSYEALKNYFYNFNMSNIIEDKTDNYDAKINEILNNANLLKTFTEKHLENNKSGNNRLIKMFFKGFWLEIYMQEFFKTKASLKFETNIKLTGFDSNKKSKGDDNELDIIFLVKDKLYIIECKSFFSNPYREILNTIYKVQGVSQRCGLPSSYIVMPPLIAKLFLDRKKEEQFKLFEKTDSMKPEYFSDLLNIAKNLKVVLVFEPEKYFEGLDGVKFENSIIVSKFHWSDYFEVKGKRLTSKEMNLVFDGKIATASKDQLKPDAIFVSDSIQLMAYYCQDDSWFIVSSQILSNQKEEGIEYQGKMSQNIQDIFLTKAPMDWTQTGKTEPNKRTLKMPLYLYSFIDNNDNKLLNFDDNILIELPYVDKT